MFALTSVFLLSLSLSSVAISPTSFADGKDGPFISQAIVDRIQNWDYRYMLVSCIGQGASRNQVPNAWADSASIESGNWFDQGKGGRVSYYSDPSDGLWGCNSEFTRGKVLESLKRFNLGSPITFICDSGGQQVNYSQGIPGANEAPGSCGSKPILQQNAYYRLPRKENFDVVSNLINTKSTSAVTISPELRYAAGWEALRRGCNLKTGASEQTVVIMADATGNKDIDGNTISMANSIVVKVINQDGSSNFVRFPMPDGDKNKRVSILGLAGGEATGAGLDMTCAQIASDMNGSNASFYAAYRKTNASETGYSGGTSTIEDSGGTKTCALEGTGWIICPTAGAIAGAADMMFKVVGKMMELPTVPTVQDAGLYKAWEVFRNIANVAFIVAFLIMVYSQITGIGGNGR